MRTAVSRILSVFLLILVLTSCLSCTVGTAEERQTSDGYTLIAVSAGKADALLLKAGDSAFLIDTGYSRSRGKILYAMELLDIRRLDGVFITHTDSDHTGGLEWLAESDIPVGAWYAPSMYTGVKKEEKHPVYKAAALRGEGVTWLKAGDSIPVGKAVLDVLAPGVRAEDKDDNNSLVLMLRTPFGSMLLCGDMEYPEEEWLMRSGADINCDVLKVPNHADDDVCSEQFLIAASPAVAVISTDSKEKPDTPDPALMELLSRRCGTVLETERTDGGISVSLNRDGIQTALYPLPEVRERNGVTCVDPSSDTVSVRNNGKETADLSGWYMIPDKKNTLFVFPQGTVLSPGQELTVGSRSATGTPDLIWEEKKLINKKKTDGITLYDRYGHSVSHKSNGL